MNIAANQTSELNAREGHPASEETNANTMLKNIKKMMKAPSVPNVDHHEGILLWRMVASLVLALNFVDHRTEFLESTLVLSAGLSTAVTEVGPVGLGFWLGDGFGNGLRCTFDFGARFPAAVTEAGPVGLYHA